MIDEDGNKYLLLDFDQCPTVDWAMTGEDTRSGMLDWLRLSDYTVLRTWQVRNYYFKKNKKTKLTQKKVEELGLLLLTGKSENWYNDYIANLIGCPSLIEFFHSMHGARKERICYQFWETHLLYAWDDISLWLNHELAIEWCEEHNIPYKICNYDEIAVIKTEQDLQKVRKRMIDVLNRMIFSEPFEFLNGVEFK